MRLPRTYYILALVASGAADGTVLLAHLLSEAGWWLTALFAFVGSKEKRSPLPHISENSQSAL